KRHSAVLNVPREKVVVMNRDHRGLCKFADKRYPYFIVHSKLEEMVAEVLRSSGNSTSPSATPVIPTSTPTSASITQQTGDRTLSLDTNEELSDTAQNPRESYDAIVSQSSSEESVNHDAPLEPRRGLHPEAQTEGIRLSSTTALNHVDPRTTSRERITRDDSPSSSQNYVSPAFRSSLNDQFLQAVKRLDTPIIYNWINDPNRRPWLKSEHVQSALLGLAGLHTGQDPRFRTLAVSVILDKCAPDLECTDAAYKATPLILAASGGRTEIVALLIEKEARLQATDGNFGRTALTWAARNNALGTAKVLLEALAGTHDRKIIHARDKDGLTALDLASQRNHQRMGNLLVSYGAIRVREES
ncbi:hypothetical protein MMC19_000927, partial [Ptychographa xylographoides]|nr:hypothetical protein [Ptychographa xylographoides]